MHYINIKRDDVVFQNIAFYKQFYDDIVKSAFLKLTVSRGNVIHHFFFGLLMFLDMCLKLISNVVDG